MKTLRLPLSIALAATMTIAAPVFAGPGSHGGSAGGGTDTRMSPSRHTDDGKSTLGKRDFAKRDFDKHDFAKHDGRHEGAIHGNKDGKVRGLERADEVAGDHGDKGRDNAEAKQSR